MSTNPNTTAPRTTKPIPKVAPTNSLISSDGKIFKVQKKRQRKIYSCIPCHQRKIGCARETPICSNCTKLAAKNPSEHHHILAACKYFDNDKKKNLKKIGVELTELQAIQNTNSSSSVPTREGSPLKPVARPQTIPATSLDSETSSHSTHKSTPNEIIPPSNTLFNDTNTDNTNFELGTTPLENFDTSDFIYVPRSNSINHNYDMTHAQKPVQEDSIHTYYAQQFSAQFIPILSTLPNKERSDELLKNFHSNIYSILSILDFKLFLQKYNEFWYCGLFTTANIEKMYQYNVYYLNSHESEIPENIRNFSYWYNKTERTLNPGNISEFLILLYAIYYTSIVSTVYEYISLKDDGMNHILAYKNEVNKYYNTFKKMNHQGLSNPRVMSLAVLQINVLVQSVVNLKSGSSLINITQIIRICQFYQLNRDPAAYHMLNDSEVVQIRRILWWQILILDNLVSFFLNLPPSVSPSGFDTSLLMEIVDEKKSNLPAMYSNGLYRFILIVDEINSLTNGLNSHLKNDDIEKLKNKISSLYVTITTTRMKLLAEYTRKMNIPKEATNQPSDDGSQFHYLEVDERTSPLCLNFYLCSLNIIPDKVLIMLHKKLLISAYIISPEDEGINPNLNLRLTSTTYTYTCMQTNLLPSLIHYLDGFLVLSRREILKFNWKLKNYIPIDELYLLMQILATNLKLGASQTSYDALNDINMKIYLVDQTINSMKTNWHLKLSSVNKLISLAENLWVLMRLKYGINLEVAYGCVGEFVVPKPMLEDGTVDSVNCSEVAPRINVGYPHSNVNINGNVNTVGYNNNISTFENTSSATNNVFQRPSFPPTTTPIDANIKHMFLSTAKLVEDELLRESITSNIPQTDSAEEGWFKLGTADVLGGDGIDDFHFYKNLKSDVVRLFRSIVT